MTSKAKATNNKKNARPSKEVKIMLKLNCSGRRIALTNPVDASSATLEDVLKLIAEQERDTPINSVLESSAYEDSNLIFIRTSIPKSQWRSTTLSQIGIENGGNALLSLNVGLTTNCNDTNGTTTVSSSNNESALSMLGISKQSSSSLEHADPERKMPSNSSLGVEQQAKKKEAIDVDASTPVEPVSTYTPRTAVEQILSSNFDADCKECCMALLKIVNNLISKPKEAKFRKINIQNTAFSQKVATKRGGIDFLCTIGFRPLHEFGVQYLVLDPQNESRHTILEAQDVLLTAASELGFSTTELPRVKPPSTIPVTESVRPVKFDIYRGQMFNTAAAAVGADPTTIAPDGDVYVSKIDRELKSLIAKTKVLEREMASKELDRGIVAYLPVSTVHEDHELVMEHGTSGKGDGALLSSRAKRILEESQKRDSGGFTTKAMRK